MPADGPGLTLENHNPKIGAIMISLAKGAIAPMGAMLVLAVLFDASVSSADARRHRVIMAHHEQAEATKIKKIKRNRQSSKARRSRRGPR